MAQTEVMGFEPSAVEKQAARERRGKELAIYLPPQMARILAENLTTDELDLLTWFQQKALARQQAFRDVREPDRFVVHEKAGGLILEYEELSYPIFEAHDMYRITQKRVEHPAKDSELFQLISILTSDFSAKFMIQLQDMLARKDSLPLAAQMLMKRFGVEINTLIQQWNKMLEVAKLQKQVQQETAEIATRVKNAINSQNPSAK